MRGNKLTFTAILLFCFGLGLLSAQLYQSYGVSLKQIFIPASALYTTPDNALNNRFIASNQVNLGWGDLLPAPDKDVLAKYQNSTGMELSEQVLLSLQAATDEKYKSALYSTNIVQQLIGQAVTISGYIVPVELNEDRSIKSFFLVPYYGACIHYPPPPPNQIIYVQLIDGFPDIMISDAFTISGFLQKGLFEDPQGTSAYILELVNIKAFDGQPDDVRQH